MAPDVRKASGRDATSALRAPVSKQRPALFSAFNVAVVLAVIIAVALIANFNRAVEQAAPLAAFDDASDHAKASESALHTEDHPADSEHAAAATGAIDAEKGGATAEPKAAKKKKALWELVEEEMMHEEHSEKVDDAKAERSGQADAAKDGAADEEAKEAEMSQIFADAKKVRVVKQDVFTQVREYDRNQHFYECGDSTTDWQVSDVVNRYVEYIPQDIAKIVPQKRYFVASVLFNDEHRVPAFTRELLKLVRLLKGHPLFVSIYEASSTDGTNAALQPLSQVLEQIGVAHVVQHGLEQIAFGESKEHFVASLRNKAMEPLYNEDTTWIYFDKVIFVDSCYFCAFDVLEMLVHSNANLVCAMDMAQPVTGHLTLRDAPAIRDIDGKPFTSEYPFASDRHTKERIIANQPVRIWGCFDGLVLIDAKPMHEHGVRFRDPGVNECKESQGDLLARDLWARGYDSFVLVPSVRTARTADAWEVLSSRKSHLAEEVRAQAVSAERVDTAPVQQPMHVACCAMDEKGQFHTACGDL